MPVTPPEKYRRPRFTAEMLTQAESSLTELDWRLLHWLLRYPLQRADDLVVGVARWASRATVYRHLQGLEASKVVESVLPKTPGEGKRLYHLSNLGLHVLARHLKRPASELAREWQVDEAGLLHRLPRLPTLMLLQEVVNGLVTHAAEALTTQGRRPQLVRWTWQREVTHRFQYREKVMRFFADGAVALCVRTPQSDGSTRDEWYGAFLFFTELDDDRLMRLRLERLLCWRESPERWSLYQHMPPVLILARSLRQRDHWQRAVERAALQLRLDPPSGGMVTLPVAESAHIDPWRLAWRNLATERMCHLRDVLKPLPHAAISTVLQLEDFEEDSHTGETSTSASHPSRPGRLIVGDLAHRAARPLLLGREEPQVIALLGLRLTTCQWTILRSLLVHPLLSSEELAVFLGLQLRSVRCSLYDLHTLGCLEALSTEVGKRWHLCERGLRLIAAANHLHLRTIAVISDASESPARQRGEAWLLQRIRHTAGIYGFFAGLDQAVQQQPDQSLSWWETGVACERRYRVGEQWFNLRPDALAAYNVGGQEVWFWLEWDRGTMNARDLEIKFASYAHYLASHEWAREFTRVPLLVCVAPDVGQERRIHRAAHRRLAHLPGVQVWTTTEELMNRSGSLATIWWRCLPQRPQAARPAGLQRRLLFDARAGKTEE